ncbi:MAG TPA: DUF4339 domain-containing protein, partial [Pirellulaceae bacterium]|nr:DUF4339 domain-containing protein [Pirellulaceae bacterium]
MKAEWFAKVNDQEYGPYTWQQMLQMAAEGRVPADLPVKRTSDKKWFTARQVPGLVTPTPTAAKAAVPTPSRPAKDDSQLRRAKPLAPSAAADAVPIPPAPPPSPPPPPRAAVQTASNSPWPVIVSDVPKTKLAATKSSKQEGEDEQPRKRSPLVIVGILASVAAVVLVAGGIGAWAVWYRPRPTAIDQVAKTPAPEANVGGGDSLALVKTAATSADDDAAPSSAGPTQAELAAQEKTVKSISSWHSVAGVKSFGVSNASLQVARVWRLD